VQALEVADSVFLEDRNRPSGSVTFREQGNQNSSVHAFSMTYQKEDGCLFAPYWNSCTGGANCEARHLDGLQE
jgi:hypothetical protein